MLFRLARAPEPTARALRLPLNEVLIAGPPASVYSSSPAHAAAREEGRWEFEARLALHHARRAVLES